MLLAVTDNAGRAGQSEHAAEAPADELRGHAEVAWVETAPDARALRDIYELYFARRVYLASGNPRSEIPRWLEPDALEQRAGHNKATVALANKLARVCWAVWKNNTDFNPEHITV